MSNIGEKSSRVAARRKETDFEDFCAFIGAHLGQVRVGGRLLPGGENLMNSKAVGARAG